MRCVDVVYTVAPSTPYYTSALKITDLLTRMCVHVCILCVYACVCLYVCMCVCMRVCMRVCRTPAGSGTKGIF